MLLGIVGFLLLLAIMVILFKGKYSPAVVFVILPWLVGLALGFEVTELGTFIQRGIGTTTGTATLFIFSIPFFYILNEKGVFDPLINFLIKLADGNPVRVTVFTVLVTILAHLDGAGASTALIAIPALLPVYKKMNMRPHLLVFIVAMSAGIMNITPWGGPTIRAAAIVGMEPNAIWHYLIPIQALGLIISMTLAVFFGIREKKFATQAQEWYAVNSPTKEAKERAAGETLPAWQLYTNWGLFIFTIVALVWLEMNASVIFMTATALALLVNYKDMKEQSKVLDRSAASVLTVVTVLLASGAMVGILEHTEMLANMGEMLLGLIPEGMGNFYNLIVGFLAAPIAVVFGTDSYFFGLLPIIMAVGEALGFAPQTAANILIIGHNFTVFVSPFTPAMFLMIGLAGVPLKEHLKFSLPWAIAASWVSIVVAFAMGII